MTDKFSYKSIWKIAYPIILGSLAQDIITVVDTAFVGRLGEMQLGAVALGGVFYLSIIMLAFGFGIGVQIIIARRYGEGNITSLKQVWQHALLVLLLLSLFLFIILRIFTPVLMPHVVESTEVLDATLLFLNFRFFGIFAAFLNIGFRAFYIGISNTKIISYTTLLMAVVNISLDYTFIFGNFSAPVMGIKGAALASVISEYTALAFFVIYTITHKKFKKYQLASWCRLSYAQFKSIVRLSTPTMLQTFISIFAWFVFFLFIEKMGQQPLAISNIIRSIYIIILVPILGFAASTNSLVSYAIGKGEYHQIKNIVKRTLLMSLLGIFGIALLGLIIPQQIISLFTNSHTLINATIPVFYVVVIAALFLAFGLIMFNALTGTGNTFTALIIEIVTIVIYLLGVYTLSVLNASIEQVWAMEIFYGASLGFCSTMYFKYGNYRKKRV